MYCNLNYFYLFYFKHSYIIGDASVTKDSVFFCSSQTHNPPDSTSQIECLSLSFFAVEIYYSAAFLGSFPVFFQASREFVRYRQTCFSKEKHRFGTVVGFYPWVFYYSGWHQFWTGGWECGCHGYEWRRTFWMSSF